MLDIKFIRQNPEFIKESSRKKQVKIDIDRLLALDKQKRETLQAIEDLRATQNKLSKVVGQGEVCAGPTLGAVKEAKRIKEKINQLEPVLKTTAEELKQLMLLLPNPPLEDVPEGKDESDNKVLREAGQKTTFKFKARDYLTLAENLDWIDVERAGKVSGSRFGYLKKTAALLEFALIQYVFSILVKEGFAPVVPPVMIRPQAMRAMGYMDRGAEEIYHLEKDDLYLVGTSEQSIGPMHMDEVFEEKELPKRYAAFSTCFRREAGSYGRDTKGILRVHQFDKVEMFSFCHPEKSRLEHQFMLSLEEKLMRGLKIPYRVLQICTGDLGDPAASKFDIEAWLPGQGEYRETHSTSNTTDFQARRLNVRFKSEKDKKVDYVHTLNGTALALGRIIIAIIENYQQKDGSVRIPKILKKYLYA